MFIAAGTTASTAIRLSMMRAFAVLFATILLTMVPLVARAQSASWTDGATENAVTFDSGQVQYRQSKPLANNTSGWWQYTIALSDIDCLQFQIFPSGEMLSVVGKANDSVLKKADPLGTTHGYEAALKHFDIMFPPSAADTAKNLLHELERASPELAKRTNKGACELL